MHPCAFQAGGVRPSQPQMPNRSDCLRFTSHGPECQALQGGRRWRAKKARPASGRNCPAFSGAD
jgi:hypothetical protein